jgi:hypothetical protein
VAHSPGALSVDNSCRMMKRRKALRRLACEGRLPKPSQAESLRSQGSVEFCAMAKVRPAWASKNSGWIPPNRNARAQGRRWKLRDVPSRTRQDERRGKRQRLKRHDDHHCRTRQVTEIGHHEDTSLWPTAQSLRALTTYCTTSRRVSNESHHRRRRPQSSSFDQHRLPRGQSTSNGQRNHALARRKGNQSTRLPSQRLCPRPDALQKQPPRLGRPTAREQGEQIALRISTAHSVLTFSHIVVCKSTLLWRNEKGSAIPHRMARPVQTFRIATSCLMKPSTNHETWIAANANRGARAHGWYRCHALVVVQFPRPF